MQSFPDAPERQKSDIVSVTKGASDDTLSMGKLAVCIQWKCGASVGGCNDTEKSKRVSVIQDESGQFKAKQDGLRQIGVIETIASHESDFITNHNFFQSCAVSLTQFGEVCDV